MSQDIAGKAPDSLISFQKTYHVLAGILVTAGLVLVFRQNYLLFHALAEFFCVGIAGGIFMVSWHSRRLVDDHFLLFLGIAYLFVGVLDFFHLLAYKGMGVFPGHDANLSTQIWIAARYLQSLSLLGAPVFIRRRLHPAACFLAFGLISAVLLCAIMVWHLFPDCNIEGSSLTRFKIVSEYFISLILLTAMGLMLKNRQTFEKKFLRQLLLALAFNIGSDLSFTLYGSVSDYYILLGHLLKIISFYLVYQAVIRTGMEYPHYLLFNKLRQSEKTFHNLFNNAEVAMLRTRMDGSEILNANEKFLEIFGWKREEVIGKPSVMHWSDPSQREEMIHRLNCDGRVVDFECGMLNRSGEVRDCVVSLNGYPDEGILDGSILDITARKQAEKNLQRYAERTAILHHLGQEILGARSPRKIASSALAHLRRMLPEAGACALLFDLEKRITIPLAMQNDGGPSPLYIDNTLAFQCDTFMNMLLNNQVTLVHQNQHHEPCRIQQAMAAVGLHFFVAAPLFVGQQLIGALCVFAEEAGPFTEEHIALIEEVATPVAMALQNARLLETISEHRQQLQNFTARLTEVEEAERLRYSREIHDELGQDLTALGINLGILQGARSLEQFPGDLFARLADSQELVEKMTEKARNIMADLRPPVLDDYGLWAALRWYGDKVAIRLGIMIKVVATDSVRFSPRQEITLFRVAQEAITNAVKHAHANHITIHLETTDTVQRLRVIDDGLGFTPDDLALRAAGTGLGMITMRERLAAIGGRLRVESAPGQGTTVIAEVVR